MLVSETDAFESFEAETLEKLRDRGLEVLPAWIAAKRHNYIGKTSTLDALELTGKNLRGRGDTFATW